jgi:tRNA 5-carboxymethoxyuridine methyltransferase
VIQDLRARFDAGARAWVDYNRNPLGRIRCEVTWHNLAPHLPLVVDPGHPPRLLDAGGGSGELALQLAHSGYAVWLLDYAPAMLDQARQAAQSLPAALRTHLTLCPMAVEDALQAFEPGFFQAITCHTLIEYLPDPRTTLRDLAYLLDGGGLLSISFVNRHAQVLRQVWSRADPAGALATLKDGSFCATLFDIPGMAYPADQVIAWLAELGFTLEAQYGVRAFADLVPRERLDDPSFFDDLLRLETEAAAHPAYNLLARYVHLIARKCDQP